MKLFEVTVTLLLQMRYLLKSTFKCINNFLKYVVPLFYLNTYRETKIYTFSSLKIPLVIVYVAISDATTPIKKRALS